MQIQKRSMNWLPKPSAWQSMEAARLKRRAYNQATLESSAAVNATLITANNTSSNAVNLTIQQAATRIRSGVKPKV